MALASPAPCETAATATAAAIMRRENFIVDCNGVCVCVCVKLSVDRSMTVAESLTKNERGRAHDPVYAKRAQE